MGLLIPRKELTGYTITGGAYTKGRYVEGSANVFTFRASVQPMVGREMEMLPEGRRNSQSYFLFSNTVLKTVEEQNPDIVLIDNEQHEVFQRRNWQNQLINHYRYIVIKLDKDKQVSLSGIVADFTMKNSFDEFAVYNEVTEQWDLGSSDGQVTFTDMSTGGPDTWLWDFGELPNQTVQNPTHPYSVPDVYPVELTASKGVDSDTKSKVLNLIGGEGGER